MTCRAIINAQQPDWSERAERKDAGRVCSRSPQISCSAGSGPGPSLCFEYIFILAHLYTYYDYDVKLVSGIKVTQD